MCTINEDHMILWFLKYKVQLTEMFVMSFFALSAPLTTQKIKILKLKKKQQQQEILSFYTFAS